MIRTTISCAGSGCAGMRSSLTVLLGIGSRRGALYGRARYFLSGLVRSAAVRPILAPWKTKRAYRPGAESEAPRRRAPAARAGLVALDHQRCRARSSYGSFRPGRSTAGVPARNFQANLSSELSVSFRFAGPGPTIPALFWIILYPPALVL